VCLRGKGKPFGTIVIITTTTFFVLLLVFPIFLHFSGIAPEGGMYNLADRRMSDEMLAIMAEGRADWREQTRLADLQYIFDNIDENYPFLDLVAEKTPDFALIKKETFELLGEEGRYSVEANFFVEFVNQHFIRHFEGIGNITLTSEAGHLPPWAAYPYFFGHYNNIFYHDRIYIPTRDVNFTVDQFSPNKAFLQVGSFLAKGYNRQGLDPFWHFNADAELEKLLGAYRNLENQGVDHLIIDLRGHVYGFLDYFIPFILAPNVADYHSLNFYVYHKGGDMATATAAAFREYFDTRDTIRADKSFEVIKSVEPAFVTPIFSGQIWLLVDSANFKSYGQMYLQLAQNAGFNLIYVEGETMSTPPRGTPSRVPFSNAVLRYNPLLFIDGDGRSLEGRVVEVDATLEDGKDLLGSLKALIESTPNLP